MLDAGNMLAIERGTRHVALIKVSCRLLTALNACELNNFVLNLEDLRVYLVLNFLIWLFNALKTRYINELVRLMLKNLAILCSDLQSLRIQSALDYKERPINTLSAPKICPLMYLWWENPRLGLRRRQKSAPSSLEARPYDVVKKVRNEGVPGDPRTSA